MTEWWGSRARNQKIAGAIPRRVKWRCVLGQGISPYLPRSECPCTYCKSLWIRASDKCNVKDNTHTHNNRIVTEIISCIYVWHACGWDIVNIFTFLTLSLFRHRKKTTWTALHGYNGIATVKRRILHNMLAGTGNLNWFGAELHWGVCVWGCVYLCMSVCVWWELPLVQMDDD